MELGEIVIKGQKFKVDVDNKGQFGTAFPPDGNYKSYPTLEMLEKELTRHLSKAQFKADIPFVRWKDDKLVRGSITGLHSRTNNVLVRWEDGTTEQSDSWSRQEDFLRIPTPELEAEFVRVMQELARYKTLKDELFLEYKFNAKKEVNDFLEKKLAASEAK